ncbi:MAG: hypothetical protein ACK54H_05230 [Phycisphaerales bacterium]
MKTSIVGMVAVAGLATFSHAGVFDSYNVGSIDQQQGWTTRDAFLTSTTVGNWDQGIVDLGDRKVWRISNAVRSTTYSSMPFSFRSAQIAGETNSALWNDRGTNGTAPISPALPGGYAATNTFYSKVQFRSKTGAAQPGLGLTLSASAKQSTVRMSYLRIEDNGSTGFNLIYSDPGANGGFLSPSVTIASGLSYTDLHTIEMGVTFVDGVSNVGGSIYGNDIFTIKLNGSLIHTGTTWEAYYYNNERITAGTPRLQAVDSVLFRVNNSVTGGTPSLSGNGFYFETVEVSNIPAPGAAALLGLGGLVASRRRRTK